jgi:hypothetical protein
MEVYTESFLKKGKVHAARYAQDKKGHDDAKDK